MGCKYMISTTTKLLRWCIMW